MIGIVLEQFRKIENSSRTLEHVFAGEDNPTCLDLAYFHSQNKTEKLLFGYHWVISIFIIVAVNLFLKDAFITHFKFVETRPRDNKIL